MSQRSRDGGGIFSLDLLLGSLSAVGIVFLLKVRGLLRLIGRAISVIPLVSGIGEGIEEQAGGSELEESQQGTLSSASFPFWP